MNDLSNDITVTVCVNVESVGAEFHYNPSHPSESYFNAKRTKQPHTERTFGDHTLQMNDVGVVKLAHDAGLRQEVSPLLFSVAGFQRLYGHADLPLARHFQATAADFTKFS